MTKLRRNLLELLFLGLLVMSSAVSLGQLNVSAEPWPCEDLQCWAQEDCGPTPTNCFCNRPSGWCAKPEIIIEN
jgi:hypothetical protein